MTAEHEPLVLSFRHLQNFQRQDEALHALKKIASMVKPIMRARDWKVGELCEFYPDQKNLLGLNENRGQRILIRLRHAGDRNQFMPFEAVVDTMLHELCHNVRGPHDQQFHALWDQLRDELDSLILKGYTGEGFLSKGNQLGGYRIPQHERLRQARAEAEKNKPPPPKTPGHRLGGSRPQPGEDIRSVIVRSIQRRNSMDDHNCANQNKNDKEIEQISEQWRRNGFRTQAEEEAANEAAIAQAYWELVQEDQKREYGDRYIPPSSQHPIGNGGVSLREATRSSQLTEYYAPQPSSSSPSWAPQPPPPVPNATRPPSIPQTTRPPPPPAQSASAKRPAPPKTDDYWVCNLCTLHNPLHATSCEVCNTPGPVIKRPQSGRTELVDLTSSPPKKKPASSSSSSYQPQPRPPPSTWSCKHCTNVMDSQWWTCSVCGQMKDKS
ncbi:zinc ion binding protein [Cladorrhinum sp. PSN332]|nr:zinc ion binding protein [Cladorrhinum sp. PSN332]